MSVIADLTVEEIKSRLSSHAAGYRIEDPFPENYFSTNPRMASVLVSLFRRDGEWHLLFIRRTEHEDDRHSGQVAFPGGKVDEVDENNIAAALRECHEEIGVGSEHLSVLGCLQDYRTVSNFLVTPVVAVMDWPVEFSLDSIEVDRVFSIPVGWLCDPENLQIKERRLPDFGVSIPVYYFQHYDGELLWGITAKITVSLLTTLGLLE